MSKDKFKRTNVKSTILKKVIIRIDFVGLTDIMSCVTSLKRDVMKGKFKKFREIKNKNYNVELNSPNSSQPFNVNMEKKIMFQFSECVIGPSNANFMLGPEFAYLEIECSEDYEGCNEYIKLMASAIDCILNFDSFISVKRLGLRKIDVALFDDVKMMNQSIEIPIWENYKLAPAYFPLKKSYSDLLFQKDVNTIFNIQRFIQEIDVNEERKIQYVLDIDCYKNVNLIVASDFSTTNSIEKIISVQMNEPIFKYFIETFTEQYINKFYHG